VAHLLECRSDASRSATRLIWGGAGADALHTRDRLLCSATVTILSLFFFLFDFSRNVCHGPLKRCELGVQTTFVTTFERRTALLLEIRAYLSDEHACAKVLLIKSKVSPIII